MFVPHFIGSSSPVLPEERQARLFSTLDQIADAVEADQEPSPAQYVQHYLERAAPLHQQLAETQIELDNIEREQDAAIVCLMSLEVPP